MGAFGDLRALPDAELEQLYDQAMATTVSSLSLYRDELLRREGARRDAELLKYTREIRWLTLAVAAATIVALAIAVVR